MRHVLIEKFVILKGYLEQNAYNATEYYII